MLTATQAAIVDVIVSETNRRGVYKLGIVGVQRDAIVAAVEKRGIVAREVGKYSGRNVMQFAIAR